MSYDGWMADWKKAEDEFVVYGVETNGIVTYLSAEAGTGSRYVVVVSALGEEAQRDAGGARMVTLRYPWVAAYPLNGSARSLVESYILEKFNGGVSATDRHGGDCAGVVLAIRAALEAHDEAGRHA